MREPITKKTGYVLLGLFIALLLISNAKAIETNYVSDTVPLITIDYPGFDIVSLDNIAIYEGTNKLNTEFEYSKREKNTYLIKVSASTPIPAGDYIVKTFGIDNFGNQKNYSELLVVDLTDPELNHLVPDSNHFNFNGSLDIEFGFDEEVIFDIYLDNQKIVSYFDSEIIYNDTYTLFRDNDSFYLNGLVGNGEHNLRFEFYDYALNGVVKESLDFFTFDGNFRLFPLNYPLFQINQSPVVLKYESEINAECRVAKVGRTQACPTGGEKAIVSNGKFHEFNIIHSNIFSNTNDFKLCYYCADSKSKIHKGSFDYSLDETKPIIDNMVYAPASRIVTILGEDGEYSFTTTFKTDDVTVCRAFDLDTGTIDINEFKGLNALKLANLFKNNHAIVFNDLNDGASYTKYIRCVNKAGLHSDSFRVDFRVDGSGVLNFDIISPSDFLNTKFVDLILESNMESNCLYTLNNQTEVMNSQNGFRHQQSVSLGGANEFEFRFECITGTQQIVKQKKITFDNIPPTINNILFRDADIIEAGAITTISNSQKDNLEFKINFTDNYFDEIEVSHFVVLSPKNSTYIINQSEFSNYRNNSFYEIDLGLLDDEKTYFLGFFAKDAANNSMLSPHFKSIRFEQETFTFPTTPSTNGTIPTSRCIDSDGDGYGLGPSCNGLDCNDQDASVFNTCANNCQIDMDGDGFGIGCDNGLDCNDRNRDVSDKCIDECIIDIDGDGYGLGCKNGLDCNEQDPDEFANCANGCILDSDIDGYGMGCDAGFDCSDVDNSIHTGCENSCVQDSDGDSFGLGCSLGEDCNDLDSSKTDFCPATQCIIDMDGDGYGWQCALGPDCNDMDSNQNRLCNNQCVYDFDGDGYGLGCFKGADCDENDKKIGSQSCETGCKYDKDCDGVDDVWEDLFGSDPNAKDTDQIFSGYKDTVIDIYRDAPINPPEPSVNNATNKTIIDPVVPKPVTVVEEFNPIWYILLVILLLAALMAGGYYVYTQRKEVASDEDVASTSSGYDESGFRPVDVVKRFIPGLSGDRLKAKWESEILKEQQEKYSERLKEREQLFSGFVNELKGEVKEVRDFAPEPQIDEQQDYINIRDLLSKSKKTKQKIELPKSAFEDLDKIIQKHGDQINLVTAKKLSKKNQSILADLIKANSKSNFIDIDTFRNENKILTNRLQEAVQNVSQMNKSDLAALTKLAKTSKLTTKSKPSNIKKVLEKSGVKNNDLDKVIGELKKIAKSTDTEPKAKKSTKKDAKTPIKKTSNASKSSKKKNKSK